VFECENDEEEMFGEERVAQLIRDNCGIPVAGLVDLVLQAVTDYQGKMPQADDITILLVRRDPE
jgi:sigma-B regulation protein RsbU (phosphoserine phosphatase)